mmetsp:Transcript_9229/g.14163  ORF Transcript_9229/g.14163 Transcript_9229/m.14163 type:complete len:212 (-) Transcript_9229:209-844(-)
MAFRTLCIHTTQRHLTVCIPNSLSHTHRLGNGVPIRHFGLFDWINKKKEAKEDQNSRKYLYQLVKMKKFDMYHFESQVEEGLKSWMTKVPGLRNAEQIKQLEELKSVIDAMTDEEKSSPGQIGHFEKQRIARKANKGMDEVEGVLFQWEKAMLLRKWLLRRKRLNMRMPRNQDEIAILARRTRTDHHLMTKKEREMAQEVQRARMPGIYSG